MVCNGNIDCEVAKLLNYWRHRSEGKKGIDAKEEELEIETLC